MADVFLEVFNISITASWIVLGVVVLRFLLKKAPKWINCILWAIVGFRLAFPFNIESAFSLIPSAKTIDTETYIARPNIQTGINLIDERANAYLGSNYFEGVSVPANNLDNINTVLGYVWLTGIIVMLIYAVYSYFNLKRKVSTSLKFSENIYICDDVDNPFILGLIKPNIYLPSGLNDNTVNNVIRHEKSHIKRLDHIWKPIGFLLLAIYWFNPVLWIAYILLCRDIELACDEKAISDMPKEAVKKYSQALIDCSIKQRIIMACPLAFGEVGVRQRIKAMINYKKPAFWIVCVSLILCMVASACFLTNPKGIKISSLEDKGNYSSIFDDNSVLTVFCGFDGYENDSEEIRNKVIDTLKQVRINKNPLSLNRSDERDKTNRIVLKNCTLNFNENFTQLWISNNVKPTLTYKILNPEKVAKAFRIMLDSMVKEKNKYQKAVEEGIDINDVDTEGNFRYTDVSSQNNSMHTTPYGSVVECFSDSKTEIYCKMLNTVDYFNNVQVMLETSMFGEDTATIYCNTDIDAGKSYEAVWQRGELVQEIYSFDDKIIDINHLNKSILNEYFPTYKRTDAPYIPLEKRITTMDDGIPGYLYRQNLSHCSLADYSLQPQGLTFSYLADFNRWEIVESNVKYLERNCIKIGGNPTMYSGNKHNVETFEMIVDSETGILLSFKGYKAGEISNYITVTDFSFGQYNKIKQYNLNEYNGYNELNRVTKNNE